MSSVVNPAAVDARVGSAAPIDETLLEFGAGRGLLGVLTRAAGKVERQSIGVVIVVGGPQTRVGSHRQFVLLARALAASGYPCLRFDYTGMGDSSGPLPDFESAGDDIRAACDALLEAEPECRSIALWGLCDGATAAVFHAATDERVATVIAANPWARSDATRSAALVKTHYGSRLRSPEFWKKLLSGRLDMIATAREAIGHVWRARGAARAGDGGAGAHAGDLPTRLAAALHGLRAKVHLQLSGRDLTATEFDVAMKNGGIFDVSSASTLRLDDSDHTFSEPASWSAVIDDTLTVLGRRRT